MMCLLASNKWLSPPSKAASRESLYFKQQVDVRLLSQGGQQVTRYLVTHMLVFTFNRIQPVSACESNPSESPPTLPPPLHLTLA